jgi:hypothetical protein
LTVSRYIFAALLKYRQVSLSEVPGSAELSIGTFILVLDMATASPNDPFVYSSHYLDYIQKKNFFPWFY